MLKSVLVFIGVVLLVAGIFSGYGVIVWGAFNGEDSDAMAQRGQFGDMFGALNAIFSTLAFLALGAGLYLQRLDLRKQDDRHARELDLATLNCYVGCYPVIIEGLKRAIKESESVAGRPYFGGQSDPQQLRHQKVVESACAAINRETDMYNDVLLLVKARVEEIVVASGKRATRHAQAYYGGDGSSVIPPSAPSPVNRQHKGE